MTLGPACPVNVAALSMTAHAGAHADAPLHYAARGASIGRLALEPYLGPCRVVHVLDAGSLVRPDRLERIASALPPRVLIRTARRALTAWSDDFTALAPESIDWLADRGVRLVGIDTASVDPATSKDLPAHQRLSARDLRVLENLVLDEIPEGDYELIALPLKLTDADASPVRAVLRPLQP
jgi:arylformamidase